MKVCTYSNIDDPRSSDSQIFPMVDIMKDGDPYMTLGYEIFTYNNRVQNKILTINDNFTYYMGNHKLTAGLWGKNPSRASGQPSRQLQ